MIVNKDVEQAYRALVDLKPKSVIATASLCTILIINTIATVIPFEVGKIYSWVLCKRCTYFQFKMYTFSFIGDV